MYLSGDLLVPYPGRSDDCQGECKQRKLVFAPIDTTVLEFCCELRGQLNQHIANYYKLICIP